MTESKSKFQFYEIVKVVSSKKKYQDVAKLKGYILGMAEENNKWYYSVGFLEKEEGWAFEESDLESTGEFGKRSDFYPE